MKSILPKKLCKFLIIPAFLSILAFSLASCGDSGGGTPTQAVESALALYKAQDYKAFNAALTATNKNFSPDTSDFGASTLKAFSQIDYAIKGERLIGTSATVTAAITAIDIKTAVSEAVSYSIEKQFSGEWDSGDEEELQKALNDYFDQYVLDPARARLTADVAIELKKVGGIWKIVPDNAFVDALTGFSGGTGNVDVVG